MIIFLVKLKMSTEIEDEIRKCAFAGCLKQNILMCLLLCVGVFYLHLTFMYRQSKSSLCSEERLFMKKIRYAESFNRNFRN